MILITGAAGFIGGNFVHHWFERSEEPVVVLDKLTYAGNPATIQSHLDAGRCTLVQGDIGDRALVAGLLAEHRPRAVLHFAAESHVDRSIHGPGEFIQTNMVGTFELLEAVRAYWSALPTEDKAAFRFLHVSTDEVYGSLSETDPAFSETTPYAPGAGLSYAGRAGADAPAPHHAQAAGRLADCGGHCGAPLPATRHSPHCRNL